jgi:hypothetical protein
MAVTGNMLGFCLLALGLLGWLGKGHLLDGGLASHVCPPKCIPATAPVCGGASAAATARRSIEPLPLASLILAPVKGRADWPAIGIHVAHCMSCGTAAPAGFHSPVLACHCCCRAGSHGPGFCLSCAPWLLSFALACCCRSPLQGLVACEAEGTKLSEQGPLLAPIARCNSLLEGQVVDVVANGEDEINIMHGMRLPCPQPLHLGQLCGVPFWGVDC